MHSGDWIVAGDNSDPVILPYPTRPVFFGHFRDSKGTEHLLKPALAETGEVETVLVDRACRGSRRHFAPSLGVSLLLLLLCRVGTVELNGSRGVPLGYFDGPDVAFLGIAAIAGNRFGIGIGAKLFHLELYAHASNLVAFRALAIFRTIMGIRSRADA